MWKCPDCHREFKNKNQWHSCVIVKEQELFANLPVHVWDLHEQLKSKCQEHGVVSVDTTKSCIYFVDQKRFLAIKPRKNGLILEFVLNREIDLFPVIKIFQIGKFRYAHRLAIDQQEDLTDEVIDWIQEARMLLKNS